MGKKRLFIITLIILQSVLIKIFPQYWLVFILVGTLIFIKVLSGFEDQVIKENSIKINKLNNVDTHFLFNAISTIMFFCRTDGNKARELLLALGDYLRYFLSESDNYMKLAEESKVLKSYLNIQQARFGEKIDYDIEEIEEDFFIKKGFLLDIVCIALKEGVLKSRVGGKITVKSRVDKEKLVIMLVNDGDIIKYINEYKDIYRGRFGYKLQGILRDGYKTELSLEIPLK